MESGRAPSRTTSRQPSRPPSRVTTSRNSVRTSLPAPAPMPPRPTSPHKTQHAHRYHHALCTKPADSPKLSAPQLLSESHESARRTPVSSILQERLQRERDADLSRSTSGSNMGSTIDLSSASGRRSPTKSIDPDFRPQSSNSSADPSRQKGPALKEMEQLLSTLHKQNFDLKLELYHRRERQTTLEEQVDSLERGKTQAEDMNETLIGELEKRDKAVEEAVAMIIMLEAKVEELTKERQMVLQVEAEGFYGSPGLGSRPQQPSTPRTGKQATLVANDDVKAISRMPSFLSVGSANTENLRNVYLGARGSVVSLDHIAEGTPDTMATTNNALVSPALSMLSESSFVSVYGQKGQGKTAPVRKDEPLPLSLDGGSARSEPKLVTQTPNSKFDERFKQSPRPGSITRVSSPGQYQPISTIMGGSPLQRIEKLDPSFTQRRQTPRPSSRNSRDASVVSRSSSRRAREEKRQGLRHVSTESPGGASLNEQLPPTPDTTSSSTLHRMRDSNGPQDRAKTVPPGNKSIAPQPNTSDAPPPVVERKPSDTTKNAQQKVQAPVTAKNLREHGAGNNRPVPIERPRSADESTISHKRGQGWESDSDNDSLQSSLDIWMRASANKERGGKASPDLFGFPTSNNKGSWAMDAMFGPSTAYSPGGATAGLDSDQIHDLLAAQHALFGPSGPLPPPHRNSSLQAQTVSADPSSTTVQQNVQTQKSPRRARPFRRNSDDAQARRDMKTPVPGHFTHPPQQSSGGDQEKHHYPPVTRQGGARQGIARLWRRSIGGGNSNNTNETSAPAAPSAPASPPTASEVLKQGEAPLQNWVHRSGVFEGERSSATPPPIMRSPRHIRNISDADAEGVPLDDGPAAQSDGPGSVIQHQEISGPAGGSTSTGGRRKWLPHIRRTSLQKTKNG